MNKKNEFYPEILPVEYIGESVLSNPFGYLYNQDEIIIVDGKQVTVKSVLKLAMPYWHFGGEGNDPFGGKTKEHPWTSAADPIIKAKAKADCFFEIAVKLGVQYYCFHDYDVVDEAPTLKESRERLLIMAEYLKKKQEETGIRLLWGTANLFSHKRYMNGAFTNPDINVVKFALAQAKTALDMTNMLGGIGYVFWGGREGYMSLLNTNMAVEKNNMAAAMRLMVQYKKSIGFEGQFMIEPKHHEPTNHQYDSNAAAVLYFLEKNGLADEFMLNIEANHATLAKLSFPHELQVAADAGKLGSIDANVGDPNSGWDTDNFPHYSADLVMAAMVIIRNGGLKVGTNFDAKTERNCNTMKDYVLGFIRGTDAMVKAMITADMILQDSKIPDLLEERYANSDDGGKRLAQLSVEEIHDEVVLKACEPEDISANTELYKRIMEIYL